MRLLLAVVFAACVLSGARSSSLSNLLGLDSIRGDEDIFDDGTCLLYTSPSPRDS